MAKFCQLLLNWVRVMRAVTSSPVPLARWRTNKAPISVPVSCLYRPPLWPHVSWCPPTEGKIYDRGRNEGYSRLIALHLQTSAWRAEHRAAHQRPETRIGIYRWLVYWWSVYICNVVLLKPGPLCTLPSKLTRWSADGRWRTRLFPATTVEDWVPCGWGSVVDAATPYTSQYQTWWKRRTDLYTVCTCSSPSVWWACERRTRSDSRAWHTRSHRVFCCQRATL